MTDAGSGAPVGDDGGGCGEAAGAARVKLLEMLPRCWSVIGPPEAVSFSVIVMLALSAPNELIGPAGVKVPTRYSEMDSVSLTALPDVLVIAEV